MDLLRRPAYDIADLVVVHLHTCQQGDATGAQELRSHCSAGMTVAACNSDADDVARVFVDDASVDA